MRRTDSYRLSRIEEIGSQLMGLIDDGTVTRELLLDDFKMQWMVTTPLYNIGEQVYALSDELKSSHPKVPWSGISGLRHRLVHDYEGTNWSIVTSIVFDEVPAFLEQVSRIRRTILEEG